MIILISEIAIAFLLIFAAKWLQDILTTFDDDHELFTHDNPCLGIAKAGYYVAIILCTKALFEGQGSGDWYEVRDLAIYGCFNIVLLNLATSTVDQFILKPYVIYDEICGKRNTAVAWVLAGSYIGSAFILNGAMAGDDGDLIKSLTEVFTYFALGQVMLTLGAAAFYKIHSQQVDALHQDNTAAGLSMAGFLAALGLFIGGLSKNAHGITFNDLSLFVIVSVCGAAFLFFMRTMAFRVLFANRHDLLKEVYEDKNQAAGWIVGLCSLSIAQLAVTALQSY